MTDATDTTDPFRNDTLLLAYERNPADSDLRIVVCASQLAKCTTVLREAQQIAALTRTLTHGGRERQQLCEQLLAENEAARQRLHRRLERIEAAEQSVDEPSTHAGG